MTALPIPDEVDELATQPDHGRHQGTVTGPGGRPPVADTRAQPGRVASITGANYLIDRGLIETT